MFFADYKEVPGKFNRALLWDFMDEDSFTLDIEKFDFMKHRVLVVWRVIERGDTDDWYYILNKMGLQRVKNTIIKDIRLTVRQRNYVHYLLDIPKAKLKCYTKKQLPYISLQC